MNVKQELLDLEARMFSEPLFSSALTFDQAQNNRAPLQPPNAHLSPAQREAILKLEGLYRDTVSFALQHGFTNGLYTGFHQSFSSSAAATPFQSMVVAPLNHPQCAPAPYQALLSEISRQQHKLSSQLDRVGRDYLRALAETWTGRFRSALQYSFYLGYRYSLTVLDTVEPFRRSPQQMARVRLTEHELGFILALEKQEEQAAWDTLHTGAK